jgi:hypothetical protein
MIFRTLDHSLPDLAKFTFLHNAKMKNSYK